MVPPPWSIVSPAGVIHVVADDKAKNPDARRTIMTLTGHGGWERFEHGLLAAAAALAASTAFVRPLHIRWQLCHPHNPAGLLICKSALWQHKVCGFVWRPSG